MNTFRIDYPKAVPARRYRYSKLRWRLIVHLLDFVGSFAMLLWRRFRPAREFAAPSRILVVQLDHMGDAVLTSPIMPRLRRLYPDAAVDVLASPSNHAVFEADPLVDHVHIASRNWFERSRGGWALVSAVWRLGRSLRGSGYELGIDVRGDLLTVLVMALAGIPRRLGWAMGGGGFLLTDIARWVPSRHEVQARLALVEELERSSGVDYDEPARVEVHATDRDRLLVARKLARAWPAVQENETDDLESNETADGIVVGIGSSARVLVHDARVRASRASETQVIESAEELHAGRFGDESPLLAVHLGAGTAAKRWPLRHWRELVARFLRDGWRVVVVGGADEVGSATALDPHVNLRDWSGSLTVTECAAFLERADLFIGVDSGPAHLAASAGVISVVLFSGTNRSRQWRPWSRRSLVLSNRVPCRPCHQKVCPLADHPCMSGLSPERVYQSAGKWWSRMHQDARADAIK